MPLPDVVFIGPLKTGTSWIHSVLEGRNDVRLPSSVKETFFFDRYYEKGLGWYDSQFDGGSAATTVEVAPSYGGFPAVPARLAKDLPAARLVMTVRDPVERTISQYLHEIRYGYYSEAIENHLAATDHIVRESMYGAILARWLDHVAPERIAVIRYEGLRDNPEAFVQSVWAAVGLPAQAGQSAPADHFVNDAREPKLAALSRAATIGADALRAVGLHGIVSGAARLGARRLLERPVRADTKRDLIARHGPRIRNLVEEDSRVFADILRKHPALSRHDGSVPQASWLA